MVITTKQTKWIIAAAVAGALIVGYFIYLVLTSGHPPSTPVDTGGRAIPIDQPVTSQGLPIVEEIRLRNFIPLFLEGYNSYTPQTLKAALNEATYGTVDFQYASIAHFEEIEQQIADDYFQRTRIDPASFRYQISIPGEVVVFLDAIVTVEVGSDQEHIPSTAKVTMRLVNDQWLVHAVEFIPTP
jgi:hypothetical protein